MTDPSTLHVPVRTLPFEDDFDTNTRIQEPFCRASLLIPSLTECVHEGLPPKFSGTTRRLSLLPVCYLSCPSRVAMVGSFLRGLYPLSVPFLLRVDLFG